MGYTVHAGGFHEREPKRIGSLYECDYDPERAKKNGDDHAWYDFYASAVGTDRDGNVDNTNVGCIHPAARSSGADTPFRPSVKNMAPRKKEWKQSETNTQLPARS